MARQVESTAKASPHLAADPSETGPVSSSEAQATRSEEHNISATRPRIRSQFNIPGQPAPPMLVLAGTLAIVLALTGLEVVLGSLVLLPPQLSGAFAIGSTIIKVVLIAGVFMRLIWDRGIHTLFVGITLAFYAVLLVACIGDRGEYDWRVETAELSR